MDEQDQTTSPTAAPVQPDVQPEVAQTTPTPESQTTSEPEAVAATGAVAPAPQAEEPAPSAGQTVEESKTDDSAVQPVSPPVAEKADTQFVASAECAAPVIAPEADAATTKAFAEVKTTVDSIAKSIHLLGEAMAKIDTRLTDMEGRIGRLAAEFAARLRFDAVKDDVISKQSKELDGFRRGALAKDMGAIIDNLILEIDGTRRIAKRFATQEPTQANYKKAVESLMDGAEALEDSVLSRAAVKRFETPGGKAFDNVRHVLAKDGHEDTEDASKVGLVARSVRYGYERAVAGPDGQTRTIIVRPEQVAVWRLADAASVMPVAAPSTESPAPILSETTEPTAGQTL